MTAHFDKHLFCWLFISFIVATVIGTMTHECGHYLVAELLGHDASLHFASTSWRPVGSDVNAHSNDSLWITLAGPLQTLLTGTLGLVLLYMKRHTFYRTDVLSISQWVLIFISLFWTRQVANFAIWLMNLMAGSTYRHHSDEIKIARYFQMPDGLLLAFSALIGILILVIVIFRFVPKPQRLSFVTAGMSGSLAGYILWIELLGQYIVP